ncbi:HAD family hydrolase [Bifidobacterium aemilianum]|uniref:HAD family hydrolase n=1 Tax=Bifidobacterium aemilianum TaxID=2493120 RepID=A0A366KB64_9BIFI|nr:HAD-IIA family hydrolase [Bifidobacterium aemilianum]RBP98363.1 HAD family hydrolase [Bifidobacterium aemilianum]
MTTGLKGSSEAISKAYGLALLDLDGVVYRGKNPVDHAAASIIEAQRAGMLVEYTTNNSSRFQQQVADQLKGFGLDVEAWQVITSSVVAARMVAHRLPAGSKVLVLGADHLRQEVSGQGFQVVDMADSKPDAVIQGWYPGMSWQELAQVSYAVEAGAVYLVTNQDLTIPRELGIAPGCGSMIQAVVNATGQEPVASAGKPESAMYDEARLLAAEGGDEPVAKSRCLAVGDRLDTDIEAGNRGGYDSLVVLTGVCDSRQLMEASPKQRPSYIVKDLRGLNESQPQAQAGSDPQLEWTAAGAWARLEGDRVTVSDASDINALRAAVSLTWSLRDSGHGLEGLVLPDFAL